MENLSKNSMKFLVAILLMKQVDVGYAQVVSKQDTVVISEMQFKNNMRKLWEEHLLWSRNSTLCLVDGLPGKEESIKRLKKNAVEIGLIMKAYYGDELGDEIADLIKTHVSIYLELVSYSFQSKNKVNNDVLKEWYANADEIAELFCSINPYWKLPEMCAMMVSHLKLEQEAAQLRIVDNWTEEILASDRLHNGMLMLADELSSGIIRQFPQKFDTGIMYTEKK